MAGTQVNDGVTLAPEMRKMRAKTKVAKADEVETIAETNGIRFSPK